MNDLIFASRRNQRPGLLERLSGAGPLTSDRQTELNAAMADAEAAIKHGDEVAREMAEARIDGLFDEYRSARADGQTSTPAPVSFDGVVRRPVRQPKDINTLLRDHVQGRFAGW